MTSRIAIENRLYTDGVIDLSKVDINTDHPDDMTETVDQLGEDFITVLDDGSLLAFGAEMIVDGDRTREIIVIER